MWLRSRASLQGSLSTKRNMFLQVILLYLFPASVWASSSANVYITSSYGQLVTSSTLRWHTTDSSNSFSADDRTVVRTGSAAVCRGWYQNQQVGGGTDLKGRCSVTFFEKRHLLEKFQVLVDTTSTSRVEWQKWDIFTKRPFGVVAFNDHAFVARVRKPSSKRYSIGELDPQRGLSGDISVGFGDKSKEEVDYVTEGEILVEIEPIRYELKNTVFMRERAKVSQEVVPLGSRVLVNSDPVYEDEELDDITDDEENEIDDITERISRDEVITERPKSDDWKEVNAVIAYNATYHYYWGQIPGLIRTLPSSADTYDNHGRQEFKWGLPLDFIRHRIRDITHRLLRGTSLNVTAVAIRQTTEVPYTAVLVSLFADGRSKEISIESTYQETVFSDVEVSHGVPFFTKNGSETPTTTSAPTTSTPIPSSSDTSTPFPTRIVFPLKPLRTTTPMPTSINPLLRFYPQEGASKEDEVEDETDKLEDGYYWDETKNKKIGKHNTRSSPMSDRWMKDGMSTAASRPSSSILLFTFLSVALSWSCSLSRRTF